MQQGVTIESTHAARIDPATTSPYNPARYDLYKAFHETDRNIFYRVEGSTKAWVYQSGRMTGLLADRPGDLGINDVGFLFNATDAAEYRWNGVSWTPGTLPVYADNTAAIAGELLAGAQYRTGADPDPVCVVH
jgi:hypothetical protein